LGSWSDALNAAAAVLGDANAKRVLANPELVAAKRAEFIRAVSVGLKGADLFETAQGKALLALLAENDRLTVLPEIAAQFDALKAEAENKIKATLVSATAVDASVAERRCNRARRGHGHRWLRAHAARAARARDGELTGRFDGRKIFRGRQTWRSKHPKSAT